MEYYDFDAQKGLMLGEYLLQALS
jgi:hypothetical protein